jgi:hypothetical protein
MHILLFYKSSLLHIYNFSIWIILLYRQFEIWNDNVIDYTMYLPVISVEYSDLCVGMDEN